jgi:Tfp pilus assembly protein PilN
MKINLDLLPQNKKAEIKRAKIFREILRQEVAFLFPVVILLVILFNVFYLLKIYRDSNLLEYQLQQGQDKYQELAKYDQAFKEANSASSLLLKIQAGHLHWANVLNHLGQAVPNGIVVSSLFNKNYNVFLAGKADTRDTLLQFKDSLEKDTCFENVNVPLSNLVVKENVDFQIDFTLSQNCLKSLEKKQ